jgi:hypothetical protein
MSSWEAFTQALGLVRESGPDPDLQIPWLGRTYSEAGTSW